MFVAVLQPTAPQPPESNPNLESKEQCTSFLASNLGSVVDKRHTIWDLPSSTGGLVVLELLEARSVLPNDFENESISDDGLSLASHSTERRPHERSFTVD